jgi:hypothetical protein
MEQGTAQPASTRHAIPRGLKPRTLTWGCGMLALVLLLLLGEAADCSKETLRRHGIDVEEGRIKKRVFEF